MAAHVPPGFFAQGFHPGPPPGFFAHGPPPGFQPGPSPQPLTTKEAVQRLLAQQPPHKIIEMFIGAPSHERNLNVLYELYRQWMAANKHELIQQMADGCLLSHFSDQLLLKGGWQNNRECLAILWQEQVQFKGNWEGDKSQIIEFWEPRPESPKAAPPVESVPSVSSEELD